MEKGLKQGRKKVLYVVTKSNFGGAQRYVYDLATHLPAEYEPVVAFGPAQGVDEPGILASKLAERGVRTVFLHELGRDIGPSDLAGFRAIRRLFADERPDIVHLNSSKAGLLGVLAARLTKVPRTIFTAHGWPFREERSLPWRMVAWLGSFATVLLADKTICVSEADRASFAVPPLSRRLARIYNGIDLSFSLGSGETIRSAFPRGVRITGTIGELTPNKNQSALIEAARVDPGLFVAIVGEGEDRPRLEKSIANLHLEERVKLFGYLPAHDVLRGFDTFALPSKKEGLPYVLIEARAAHVQIEARRTGGVPEVLDLPLETFSLERMVAETIALY